jgi:hypothetical protein
MALFGMMVPVELHGTGLVGFRVRSLVRLECTAQLEKLGLSGKLEERVAVEEQEEQEGPAGIATL